MKKVLLGLIVGALSSQLLTVPAAAQTQTFTGQPVTIKDTGTHYQVLGYELLKQPLPEFDYDDPNEFERYLLVHLRVERSEQASYPESPSAYDFYLWNGPNYLYSYTGKLNMKKYPQLKQYLLTGNNDDKFKTQPGKAKNFDILFVVDPASSLKLSLDINDNNNYVWLKQIKSSNGVTAD